MKSKTLRRILIITTIIAFLTAGTFITANHLLKNKATNFLKERIPEHISITYDNVDVKTFSGTITVTAPRVTIANLKDKRLHTRVSAQELIVSDISYLDYLFKKQITIEDITLKEPSISYHKGFYTRPKATARSAPIKIYKPILLEQVSINNAEIHIFDATKDSLLLKGSHITLAIEDVFVSSGTLLRKLPLDYSDYYAQGKDLFIKSSPYENLKVASFVIEKGKVVIDSIALKTKYGRTGLSKNIKKERDHFDLAVPKVEIDGFKFGFDNESLFTQSETLILNNPYLDIFRDKLVQDDLSTKPLYSKMLRELPFALTVSEIQIKNGNIVYTEKVKQDNDGGTINFTKINSRITNASNTYTYPVKTEIAIKALFMDVAPVQIDWSFDTNDPQDNFLFKASIGQIASDQINPFIKPNLNIALEGMVDQTYFTLSGDTNRSHIDMRMKYENFKVEIMRKDKTGINKLLSGVANLFIKKNSKSENTLFNEGSGNVARDKTTSFFNYLWLNIKTALVKTVSSRG